MTNYLTVKEVQEKLKVGERNAYKLVNLTGFPKIRIGKKILVPEDELEEYLKNIF